MTPDNVLTDSDLVWLLLTGCWLVAVVLLAFAPEIGSWVDGS